MAGEAPQLSFIQGEISPEFYYRSDLTGFNSSLSKGENIEIEQLGGFRNRLGSTLSKSSAAALAGALKARRYAHCVFSHPIYGTSYKLEVTEDIDGLVRIYLNGERADLKVSDDRVTKGSGFGHHYRIVGDIEGLTFIQHKDLLIFSRSLRVEILKSSVDLAFHQYGLPAEDPDYIYTETQFAFRMVPETNSIGTVISGIRFESNFTLQNVGSTDQIPTYSALTTRNTEKVSGAATYVYIAEDDKGKDNYLFQFNTIPGVDMTGTGGTVKDVIPYPVAGSISNQVNYSLPVNSVLQGYGDSTITKMKVYRSTGKKSSLDGLFKLVAKMGATSGGGTFNVNDTGQEEAAYTVCSDTSMLYRNPSLSLMSSPVLLRVLGGLKSVVSTAVYQQRAYYAINKNDWWGTSVYDNTIVVSRLNAPQQIIQPQITNPAEAFQFDIPEERGGKLTHVVAIARLLAFTDVSTYVVKGDEAGIISPTAINPEKLLSFGAMKKVPPAVSGNLCVFAASCGGVGFVQVDGEGNVRGGIASVLSSHMFEGKEIMSITSKGDSKGFPRFSISTMEGDVIDFNVIGETFSFTKVNFLPLIEGSTTKVELLPFTQILDPRYREGAESPDYEINYAVSAPTYPESIFHIKMSGFRTVRTKYLDYSDHLDYRVRIGGYNLYQNRKWAGSLYLTGKYESDWGYSSDMMTGDYLRGVESNTSLVDPTGNWAPHTEIGWSNGGNLLFPYYGMGPDWKFKFTWKDSGAIVNVYADHIDKGGGVYAMSFEEEVPAKLRNGGIVFVKTMRGSVPTRFNMEEVLDSGSVIIEIVFTELLIESYDYISEIPDYYYPAVSNMLTMRGYTLSNPPSELDPMMFPITIESNGNIYGNFKDPNMDTPYYIEYYLNTVRNVPVFRVVLPELTSYVSMGIPAIGEADTLPIASIERDITDAHKNINYASVLMYKTKGLRVGEVGQSDDMLEKFDFTTDDSVSTPVEFSGPKSYNFSSTWNEHGMIRISGLDLQPFTVSGIIPKGNVGS